MTRISCEEIEWNKLQLNFARRQSISEFIPKERDFCDDPFALGPAGKLTFKKPSIRETRQVYVILETKL